ncbi:MAG: class I SAM-dependent methyltransferase [bacterium]|nr:class I SAM-dependent methyltransferase [bacterium]
MSKNKISNGLPLALIERNRVALAAHGLKDPLLFDSEESLFAPQAMGSAPEAESAIVLLPKGKALIDMTLAFASKAVRKGGVVVLTGENDAGIRSANVAFEANIGPVQEKMVGNHSALYVGMNEKLTAHKNLADFLAYEPIVYKNGTEEIAVDVAHFPGVFNTGKLDAGTRLLLSHIPYGKKRVIDVGCGAGVIGTIYKKLSPDSEVSMCDKSRLAVLATKETLKKNGVEADVFESDVLAGVTRGADGRTTQFDLIVSNPPFHTGIATDYAFIDRLSHEAKNFLAPSGELYVVANSFLPYERTLEMNVGPTTVVKDDGKFKVIRTTLQ